MGVVRNERHGNLRIVKVALNWYNGRIWIFEMSKLLLRLDKNSLLGLCRAFLLIINILILQVAVFLVSIFYFTFL